MAGTVAGAVVGIEGVEVLYFLKKLGYCLAGNFSMFKRPSRQRLKVLLNKSSLSKAAGPVETLLAGFSE